MKQLKKLLFPHGFVVFLLFNLTIVLLVYSLGYPEAIPVIQYISYAISAYALVVVCFRIPGIIRWWKNILYGNKLTAKYLTEKHVRDMVSLYTGIGMDLAMAVLKVVIGIFFSFRLAFCSGSISCDFGTHAFYAAEKRVGP